VGVLSRLLSTGALGSTQHNILGWLANLDSDLICADVPRRVTKSLPCSLAAAHQLDFALCVSGKSLQWQVSQNQKENCSMTDLLLKAAASVAARRCIMKSYVL
jgi:hypothetical protein